MTAVSNAEPSLNLNDSFEEDECQQGTGKETCDPISTAANF